MKTKKINILFTSAGRRTYLINYFKEIFDGSRGEVHAGNSKYSVALNIADKNVITPEIYDKKFIYFLIDYCKKNHIGLIIPLFDIDLPVLAMNKAKFEKENIYVLVSDHNITQICNDKWKTYNFLLDNGFKSPATYIDKDKVIADLANGLIKFPLMIKPRWGMGSIGIEMVDNLKELEVIYNKLKRNIFDTYLSFESSIDKENCLIIQEKIFATEYGLDIINDLEKNYITTFVKKKLSMRSGETDHAITVDNPVLRNIGKKISNSLKHIGPLDVDCFGTEKNIFVLELNCRFGGGYPFSHLAGANIPLAIMKWLNKQKAEENLFQIKYEIEGIKNINPIIVNRNHQNNSFTRKIWKDI